MVEPVRVVPQYRKATSSSTRSALLANVNLKSTYDRGEEEKKPTIGTTRNYSHINEDGSFTFGYEGTWYMDVHCTLLYTRHNCWHSFTFLSIMVSYFWFHANWINFDVILFRWGRVLQGRDAWDGLCCPRQIWVRNEHFMISIQY